MNNANVEERERLTRYVRDELQAFTRLTNDNNITPINVQFRLSEDALYRKYVLEIEAVNDETSNS